MAASVWQGVSLVFDYQRLFSPLLPPDPQEARVTITSQACRCWYETNHGFSLKEPFYEQTVRSEDYLLDLEASIAGAH
ncbi:hypothetical protein [Marinobacter subterrani]|nr:hypothetical protein [Marinobacter subterrani]